MALSLNFKLTNLYTELATLIIITVHSLEHMWCDIWCDMCDIRYVLILYDKVGRAIWYDMVCDMIHYAMLYGMIYNMLW